MPSMPEHAKPAQEPVKKEDEDKRGGVKNGGGTTWWIATRFDSMQGRFRGSRKVRPDPVVIHRRKSMRISTAVIALALIAFGSIAIAGQPSTRTVFDRLKTLEGDWRSTSGKTTVNYRLIANGSSIVETWTMSPTRQSMTVYTMDGNQVIATHYCPQGNAPRLRLSRTGADGTHYFEFLDGANLQKSGASHEHAFWVRLDSADTLVRSETYIENGSAYDPEQDLESVESFSRAK